MALSSLLVDTYRRYKQDNKIFIQWLAAAARATGTVDDLFPIDNSNTARKDGRKKGKQRTKQKLQEFEESKEHIVPVGALVRLANAVATAHCTKVPASVLDILKSVIKARRACANFYKANTHDAEGSMAEHNKGHEYIINVLDEVLGILSPLVEKGDTITKSGSGERSGYSTNLYDLLETEDCGDFQEPTPPMEGGKTAKGIAYEPETSPADISMAIFCFMKDMTDIRLFIRRTWLEYKARQITLNTAATIANTALDVMRRFDDKFTCAFPQFGMYWDLVEYVDGDYDKRGTTDSMASEEALPEYVEGDINLSFPSFFCVHVASLVTKWYEETTLPMYCQDINPSCCLLQEEKILLQLLSHLAILDTFLMAGKAETQPDKFETCIFHDQVLQAVRTMRAHKKFPVWSIFAVQSLVDTRRDLGADVERGFQDLQHGVGWIMRSWTDLLERCQRNREHSFHKENGHKIRLRLDSMQDLMEKDFFQGMIDEYFKHSHKKRHQCSYGLFFLFRNNPLMSGSFLQMYLTDNHSIGIRVASDFGPVRIAMHLMNAVSLSDVVPDNLPWADLEYIIRKHGDAHIFVDRRPASLVDCFAHLCMAFGKTPSGLLLSKEHKGKKSTRQNMTRTEASWYGHRRFYAIARFTNAQLKGPGNSGKHNHVCKDAVLMMDTLVSRLVNTEDLLCPANPNNERIAPKIKSMTPLQSLRIYKQALKEDDFALRFDFWSLNRRCTDILRKIERSFGEKFPCNICQKYLNNDFGSTHVVEALFLALKTPKKDPPFLELFKETCKAINQVISQEGNAEYIAAVDRMGIVSGCASKEIQERFEDPWYIHIPVDSRRATFVVNGDLIIAGGIEIRLTDKDIAALKGLSNKDKMLACMSLAEPALQQAAKVSRDLSSLLANIRQVMQQSAQQSATTSLDMMVNRCS